MRGKRTGFSLGTILTLALTIAVAAGCVFVLGKMRGDETDAQMNPQQMIGLVSSALQGATAPPEAQATVRTVTVTLAPVTLAPAVQTPAGGVPTPSPAPDEPYQAYSFSVTAGGLLAFESEITDTVYNKADKSADYLPIVSPLRSKIFADMNIVTLPQIINVDDRKYADSVTLPEAAAAIRGLGVDEVALGTEHILDQGLQKAADTVASLAGQGLSCEGVNAGGAAQHRLLQLNGCGVAILSYTEALTAKGKNALKDSAQALSLFDLESAGRDIQWARAQGARCVIVCVYWGKTDTASVTAAQRSAARALAEMGADVILGARPSRVLPMEEITVTGLDGRERKAFVAYSLGTLLTESREAYDISGVLLHLNIACDTLGACSVTGAEYTPTYIWRQAVNGKTQYRLLCSAEEPPPEMNDQQKQVMQRALTRVQNTLRDSPVAQRR